MRQDLALGAAPFLALALLWLVARPSEPSAEAIAAAQRVTPREAAVLLQDLQNFFPNRVPGSRSHQRGAAYIASSLSIAGARDVQIDLHLVGEQVVFNVLGRIPGVDRTRKVVLAAHHDTVPEAPGAIDDGGAIAAILAATHALSSGPPPACDVEIAIFDAEEWGCQGSKAHLARDPERERVHAALAVELVGWKRDRLVAHTLPYGFAWDAKGIAPSWLPNALARAGRAAEVSVGLGDPKVSLWYQGTVRVMKVWTGSDAGAYSEAGLPAVMLTGSSLTNFYSHYHQPTDTLEQVDVDRLDEAARTVAAAAHELAQARGDPSLGQPYLVVGGRTLGRLALALLGLFAALVAGLSAVEAFRARRRFEAACFYCLWIGVGVLSVVGSVLGVLCFFPLVCAFSAARRCKPVARVALTILGGAPALIEVLLITAATSAFGFAWRAGVVETLALGICFLAAPLLAAALGSTATPLQPASD